MLEPAGERESSNPAVFWAGFATGVVFACVVVVVVVAIVEGLGF